MSSTNIKKGAKSAFLRRFGENSPFYFSPGGTPASVDSVSTPCLGYAVTFPLSVVFLRWVGYCCYFPDWSQFVVESACCTGFLALLPATPPYYSSWSHCVMASYMNTPIWIAGFHFSDFSSVIRIGKCSQSSNHNWLASSFLKKFSFFKIKLHLIVL